MRPFLNYINSQNEATKKKQKSKKAKNKPKLHIFFAE
jgi:hypothetical protein